MINEILQLVNSYNKEVDYYQRLKKEIQYDSDYFLSEEIKSIKKSKQELELKLQEFIIATVKQEFNI